MSLLLEDRVVPRHNIDDVRAAARACEVVTIDGPHLALVHQRRGRRRAHRRFRPAHGMITRMQPIVDFILELDKLKAVTRATRPLGLDRYENSAEHSWQIAMLAVSLAPYADDAASTSIASSHMLLVHDIGEIDTGDTIVYAEDGWEARKAAERAAVARIFGLLPETQGAPLLVLWQEFEDAVTPEARFAHAVDRAMPALLNLANGGQSWRENGISHARVVARIGPPIRGGLPRVVGVHGGAARPGPSGRLVRRARWRRAADAEPSGALMPTPPDLVIRRAIRDDLPAIVHLLADDQLGATREADVVPLPASYQCGVRSNRSRPESGPGRGGRRRPCDRRPAAHVYPISDLSG